MVEVDVQAIGRDGRPVVDLAPREFSLMVDGKPRTVSSLELITYDAGPAFSEPAVPADPAEAALTPASFSSNRTMKPGRLFVLIADQGNMTRGGGRGAMEAIGRFLDKLSPADRVGFVTLPVGPSVEFTADRALVSAAALKVVGGGASRYEASYSINVSLAEAFSHVTGVQRHLFEQAVQMECRSMTTSGDVVRCRREMEVEAQNKVMAAHAAEQATVQALRSLFDRLAGIEGPKHVVFVGQGLVTGSSFSDLKGLADLNWVAARAQAARVTMYVLQVGNAFLQAFDMAERHMTRTTVEDARLIDEGLGELAAAAGGTFISLNAKVDPAFDRIARETAAGWVLRFDVDPADRDGKPHAITVRVSRPDVTVRARTSFLAPSPGSDEDVSAGRRLGRAVTAPFAPRSLGIDLTTAITREPGADAMQLHVAADIGCGPQAPSAANVVLALTLANGTTRTLTPAPTAAAVPRGADECLYYSTVVRVTRDETSVRVAAVSDDGRVGAVDRRLNDGASAPGSLRLGQLLLTDPDIRVAGRMKVVVDGSVRDRVAAYIEADTIGDAAAPAAPALRFEVAPALDAPPLVIVPVEMTADGSGRWYAEAMIDLRPLAAGRYVLRVVASGDAPERVRKARLLRVVR
jgi:VWFA-related protein